MDFKKLIRLLTPIMVEGIFAVRRNSRDRLVEMLHELEFLTRSVDELPDGIVIKLQILDINLLHRLLIGEANKFLLASRISHDRATQSQANNASWQAVEHYYAAYYGVHYLLRLTGVSVTNLDSRASTAIERSALGIVLTSKIPAGLYTMDYNDQSNILTLKKKNKKNSGGSHQDVWQLWDSLVDKLKTQTNIDPVEYACTAIELAEHRRFLVRSTAKYNPPEIRGEINYQFKGGSWIFEVKAQDSIDRIQRSISNQKLLNLTPSSTPEGLIESNKFIIGLAKAVFLHGVERYPNGICRTLANKYSAYIA